MGIAQYALGLSPVVLFIRRSGIRAQISQSNRISFFGTIGDNRPEPLAKLERDLWKWMTQLAIGRTSIVELVSAGCSLINAQLGAGLWENEWFKTLQEDRGSTPPPMSRFEAIETPSSTPAPCT